MTFVVVLALCALVSAGSALEMSDAPAAGAEAVALERGSTLHLPLAGRSLLSAPQRQEAVEWEADGAGGSPNRGLSAERSQDGGPYVAFFPNPVRKDVTFLAQNVCWCQVRGLRVRIYDTAGALVWTEESTYPIVEYDVDGGARSGQPLPNGTYFVQSELRVGSIWRSTGLDKLVVLR
jgi:hypothetical protein